MSATLAKAVLIPSPWTITSWEVGLLAAGAVITVGILVTLIFVLTRKDHAQKK